MQEDILKGNYTVAFLDILGFKEMVMNIPLEELVRSYEYSLMQVANSLNQHSSPEFKELSFFKDHPLGEPFCTKYIFSDSIILFPKDASPMSCFMLMIYAWRLTQYLLAAKFPVRGAVTHGEIYINNHYCPEHFNMTGNKSL